MHPWQAGQNGRKKARKRRSKTKGINRYLGLGWKFKRRPSAGFRISRSWVPPNEDVGPATKGANHFKLS